MFDPFAPYYSSQHASLEALAASGLWQHEAAAALTAKPPASMNDELGRQFDLQRLHKIQIAGLAHNENFRAAFTIVAPPHWTSFTSPPVPLELQHGLAAKLYNLRPGHGDVGQILASDGARDVTLWLAERARADGHPFIVQFGDAHFDALVFNYAEEAGITALAADLEVMAKPVTRRMVAGAGAKSDPPRVNPEKSKLYKLATADYQRRRMSANIFYTLTRIPSPRDAIIDDIPYEDYLTLFFEMCDQPWDRIGKAHEKLIAEFNIAETVRITNNDGTDVSMSLVDHDGSHFTFCNSLIAKNVPGSEIFSAPRKDSVNGIVVAKGKFSEHGSKIMENLTLEFKDGYLIYAKAERGQNTLDRILSLDDGTRYVGELGIGTNPRLTRQVVDILLVEKTAGSFHLALGACYKYTDYVGTPVKVDNGNESRLHWDITTMLRGKQGRIYLDGRIVMNDGFWIDPAYDILNRGWAAVPRDERPEYWREKV